MPRQTDYARDDPHAELHDVVWNGYTFFSPQSMIDDLVEEARRWRPDLVIWDAITFAGPVAARASGAAHARLIFGSDGVPQLRNGFREQRHRLAGAGLTDPFQDWLEPILARYGCEFGEDVTVGQWTIDPMPPWHWRPSGVHYLLMRHVPYNGGAQVPDWLADPPERRRVCITLGFTHREHFGSEASAADLLDAVAGLNVEVVATLNAKQLHTLPTVPDNVRLVDFVPMNLLMPTCSAVVHHGGGGAFAAAVEHGVPQLIVPSSFANLKWWGPIAQANSLEEYGAGRYVADSEHLTPQALREDLVRVLDDPSFARNAAGLAAALRTAPAPSDIVPALEELTATHRGTAA
jgi:glycosyltransferase (activator-dependent family)